MARREDGRRAGNLRLRQARKGAARPSRVEVQLARLEAQQQRMTDTLGQLAQGQLALARAMDLMLRVVEQALGQLDRERRRPRGAGAQPPGPLH